MSSIFTALSLIYFFHVLQKRRRTTTPRTCTLSVSLLIPNNLCFATIVVVVVLPNMHFAFSILSKCRLMSWHSYHPFLYICLFCNTPFLLFFFMTTTTQKSNTSRHTYQAILALICGILTTALYRFFISGPFIPISCSILGIQCNLFEIPFEGYVHEDFAEAATAFRQNFYQGEDVGASVAAYVDNQLVLDLHGGWQDIENKIPYTSNTLQIVYSSTKMLVSLLTSVLRFIFF